MFSLYVKDQHLKGNKKVWENKICSSAIIRGNYQRFMKTLHVWGKSLNMYFNTLRLRQNGCRFTDITFKCIFLNKNVRISIKILLNLVPKGPINNNPALVQIMAWRRSGNKPLSEPMILVYWRIYASSGLNELNKSWEFVQRNTDIKKSINLPNIKENTIISYISIGFFIVWQTRLQTSYGILYYPTNMVANNIYKNIVSLNNVP